MMVHAEASVASTETMATSSGFSRRSLDAQSLETPSQIERDKCLTTTCCRSLVGNFAVLALSQTAWSNSALTGIGGNALVSTLPPAFGVAARAGFSGTAALITAVSTQARTMVDETVCMLEECLQSDDCRIRLDGVHF